MAWQQWCENFVASSGQSQAYVAEFPGSAREAVEKEEFDRLGFLPSLWPKSPRSPAQLIVGALRMIRPPKPSVGGPRFLGLYGTVRGEYGSKPLFHTRQSR